VQNNEIFILEVNPRASRTVPFVSKSIGLPIIYYELDCMLGKSLQQLRITPLVPEFYAVKQSVFPFNKFPGADPLLGPEMRSTGEVMCFGATFAEAYLKSMQAISGVANKFWSCAYLSVDLRNQSGLAELGSELKALNVQIYADHLTASALQRKGIACKIIIENDTIISLIASGTIDFVVSTLGFGPGLAAARAVRAHAVKHRINFATTVAGARAMVLARKSDGIRPVYKLQALHEQKVYEYEH
jgi:carbamoyl-phosphate synthase large subunit